MYCLLRPFIQMLYNLLVKLKLKYLFGAIALFIVLDFFGAFTHIFEIKYDEHFKYPYNGDVHRFVEALRHNQKPEVDPINQYNYTFLHEIKDKCFEDGFPSLRIVYIVKSAIDHFDRRLAIRNTWGFEKRFFDVPSKTVFLLGVRPNDEEVTARVKAETTKYNDIVQADFIDSYYNNTIKTMIGFKWAMRNCRNSKFYMFVDDDIYVSVKNVLRFIINPTNYPEYLKEPNLFQTRKREIRKPYVPEFVERVQEDEHNSQLYPQTSGVANENVSTGESQKLDWNSTQFLDNLNISSIDGTDIAASSDPPLETKSRPKRATAKEKIALRKRPGWTSHNKTKFFVGEAKESDTKNRTKRQLFDFELPEDVRLFAGFVFVSSPHRHKSSKWYVSLDEYPYNLWPPYVTAGSYILSKEALLDLYYTSLYTKHFRFDDIFLGLVAKKADIEPFHSEEFHFYKKDYTKYNYKYVISSHGYGDPNELLQVWNEQKALGNA